MDITFCDYLTPKIFLKNIFDESTLKKVYEELETLEKYLKKPELTGSATDDSGILLKKNKGIFLNEVYSDPKYSVISNFIVNNIWKNSTIGNSWKFSFITRIWESICLDSILLSYYENYDYYNPHHDISFFTFLIWIWKEPKQFEGGDLQLVNHENIIHCQNNCGVIFLSPEKHAVTPVSLKKFGFGRYCITTFFNF